MGSSPLVSPELTLDSTSSKEKWIAYTAGDFIAQICRYRGLPDKIPNLDDYFNRLQDEMKKIDAFKREFPLCMLLLRDAITILKQEVILLTKSNSEPVLEEFLPLKKSRDEKFENSIIEKDSSRDEKMNWLSSVQLWCSGSQNQQSSPDSSNNKRKNATEGCNSFGFNERKDEVSGSTLLSLCTDPATTTTQVEHLKEETNSVSKSSSSRSGASSATNVEFNSKSSQTARKQRRCWSPELHRGFIHALQQLGGAQAATPKQIRELMQVDGLTNDEVKSHLQKYRLHARRVPPPTANTNNNSTYVGSLMMSRKQWSETASMEDEEDGISEIHNQYPR